MALPERLLVDTSAFYALVSPSDIFHERAQKVYESLVDWEPDLWTTSYVLAETFALIHRRLGIEPLRKLMDPLQDTIQVLWVERSVHGEAWREFVARQGAALSFVDWTTAVAAKRLRAHVFTFDQGFEHEAVPVFK